MKYRVGNRIFNSDKAELIASSKMLFKDSGYDEGLGRWRELYKTQKGNWVMVDVSCWQGSQNKAYKVDENQARTFILDYGSEEQIEEYCNDMEEI